MVLKYLLAYSLLSLCGTTAFCQTPIQKVADTTLVLQTDIYDNFPRTANSAMSYGGKTTTLFVLDSTIYFADSPAIKNLNPATIKQINIVKAKGKNAAAENLIYITTKQR